MVDYVITRTSSDELAHFGTKGMKWGVRRYQNEDGTLTSLGKERYGYHGQRSAMRTAMDLNKLDREQTQAQYKHEYYSSKVNNKLARAKRKLAKAKRNNDQEKVQKYSQKIKDTKNSKAMQKAKDYQKLYERSKAMTDKIIKESLKKGYSIHSKEVMREVSRGAMATASLLGTMGGATLSAALGGGGGMMMFFSNNAKGTHYSVRNDGLGTRTHKTRPNSIISTTVLAVPRVR